MSDATQIYKEKFDMYQPDTLSGETLALRYIPLSQAVLWDDNAKLHDLDAIIVSIQTYGFRDPPSWDEQLGGIVEGNGRVTALKQLFDTGNEPPRGIATNKETGEWCVPMVFGLDASSKNVAMRYAVDHNNLVLSGGGFTAFDMAKMWDKEGYKNLLNIFRQEGELPASMDLDDIEIILDGFDFHADTDFGNLNDNPEEMGGKHIAQVVIKFSNIELREEILEQVRDFLMEFPQWEAVAE